MNSEKPIIITSSFTQDVAEGLFGHIDAIDASGITGWIIDAATRLDGGEISAWCAGMVATGIQEIARQDITELAELKDRA